MPNHDEILAMEAGPDLDALIRQYFGVDGTPSTDIAPAWEVVEKLIAADNLNLFIDFTEARERGDAAPWRCCLEAATYVGEGSTAPLAICKAALMSASCKHEETKSME